MRAHHKCIEWDRLLIERVIIFAFHRVARQVGRFDVTDDADDGCPRGTVAHVLPDGAFIWPILLRECLIDDRHPLAARLIVFVERAPVTDRNLQCREVTWSDESPIAVGARIAGRRPTAFNAERRPSPLAAEGHRKARGSFSHARKILQPADDVSVEPENLVAAFALVVSRRDVAASL